MSRSLWQTRPIRLLPANSTGTLLLEHAADYNITGNTIGFSTGAGPQSDDSLLASYRTSVALPGVGFVDAETPGRTVDGVNTVFTLAQNPNPAAEPCPLSEWDPDQARNGLYKYGNSMSFVSIPANRRVFLPDRTIGRPLAIG